MGPSSSQPRVTLKHRDSLGDFQEKLPKGKVLPSVFKKQKPPHKVMVAVKGDHVADHTSGLTPLMVDALSQADVETQRATKFVLGVLRDRFALRSQFTKTFRRIDQDKSNRINKRELGDFLINLSCPITDHVLDLVMLQLDPDNNGVELSELVDNMLALGAWGVHDPFMANALRSERSDAKLAQVAARKESMAVHDARARLRRSVPSQVLERALSEEAEARLTFDAEDGNDSGAGGAGDGEMGGGMGATAGSGDREGSRALSTRSDGSLKDPFAGTLDRREFLRSVGHISSLRAEHLDALAPPQGSRVDIHEFCSQLGDPTPASLGYSLTLPAGERRPVALPRLPGKMSRYVSDDRLRALVDDENERNQARFLTDFTLSKDPDPPLLRPQPFAF